MKNVLYSEETIPLKIMKYKRRKTQNEVNKVPVIKIYKYEMISFQTRIFHSKDLFFK